MHYNYKFINLIYKLVWLKWKTNIRRKRQRDKTQQKKSRKKNLSQREKLVIFFCFSRKKQSKGTL